MQCLQVREVRLHYSTATGPCAARALAQSLWAGEEFVLQVDAHMRFVQVGGPERNEIRGTATVPCAPVPAANHHVGLGQALWCTKSVGGEGGAGLFAKAA